MKLTTLDDLLLDQIKDIYFAEKHLTKALPKLARAAESDELKRAFTDHLKETQQHVVRLERVFKMLGAVPKAKRCPAIIELIEEGGEMIDEDANPEVRDAGLIAAAQRVEHYEIAAYGCARAFAKRLGLQNVADILTQTIEEEGNADKALTAIAEGRVNDAAASAADDGELRASPRSTARSAVPRPRASARRAPSRRSGRLAGASA
jgi:ferritin-like metal-binding protein YciE